jgi:disulfide bond formation protein DsbB
LVVGLRYRPAMSVDTLSTFFAVVTLVVAGSVIGALLLWLASLIWPAADRLQEAIVDALGDQSIWLAWLAAIGSTVGSLYYSLVAHYTPCNFCWYQRIAMFPLVAIIGVAIFGKDDKVARYVLPLTGAGALLSIYQYLLERFPSLESGACDLAAPCSVPPFTRFGFVTLSLMGLVAAAAISVAILYDRAYRRSA